MPKNHDSCLRGAGPPQRSSDDASGQRPSNARPLRDVHVTPVGSLSLIFSAASTRVWTTESHAMAEPESRMMNGSTPVGPNTLTGTFALRAIEGPLSLEVPCVNEAEETPDAGGRAAPARIQSGIEMQVSLLRQPC